MSIPKVHSHRTQAFSVFGSRVPDESGILAWEIYAVSKDGEETTHRLPDDTTRPLVITRSMGIRREQAVLEALRKWEGEWQAAASQANLAPIDGL